MIGSSTEDGAGLIPSAISWLFRGIGEQKSKTGARFSVRVSAVEIAGPAEVLRDLLAQHATGECRMLPNSPALTLCSTLNRSVCEANSRFCRPTLCVRLLTFVFRRRFIRISREVSRADRSRN